MILTHKENLIPYLLLVCCLALLTGVVIPHASTRLNVRELTNIQATYGALFISLMIWGGGVLLYKARYGTLDWIAPPIAFGALYILSSLGRLFVGYYVYDANVKSYLLLFMIGLVSFMMGFYLKPGHGFPSESKSFSASITQEDLGRMRSLAKTITIVGWSLMGFVKLRGLGRYGMTSYGQYQFTQGLGYYLSVAGSLLFVPAIAIYYYATVQNEDSNSREPLFFLVTYVIFRALSGNRMLALLPVLGVIMVHHYAVRRIQLRHLLLGILLMSLFLFAVVTYRDSGYSIALIRTSIQAAHLLDFVNDVLVAFGSPASICTNLIRWFPQVQGWLYGRSYIDAVFNLIPGFFFGRSLERPFISASYLYKDLLEEGRFNPSQGYGGSLLGESFMNFGYFGPLIVFFILGLGLRAVYDRAVFVRSSRRWWSLLLYAFIYLPLFIGLRSDAVGTLKQVVYNLLALGAVVQFSPVRPRGGRI